MQEDNEQHNTIKFRIYSNLEQEVNEIKENF